MNNQRNQYFLDLKNESNIIEDIFKVLKN